MPKTAPFWAIPLALFIGVGLGLLGCLRSQQPGQPPLPAERSVTWTIHIGTDPDLKQPAWTDQGDLESPRDYYLFRDPTEAAAAKRAARGLLTDHFSRLLLGR